jgi:hypothetical protein
MDFLIIFIVLIIFSIVSWGDYCIYKVEKRKVGEAIETNYQAFFYYGS